MWLKYYIFLDRYALIPSSCALVCETQASESPYLVFVSGTITLVNKYVFALLLQMKFFWNWKHDCVIWRLQTVFQLKISLKIFIDIKASRNTLRQNEEIFCTVLLIHVYMSLSYTLTAKDAQRKTMLRQKMSPF